MSDETDKDRQDGQPEAVDAFAAATAVGFAVASRTMEMWFGAMSGFARASREIMAPHLEAQLREVVKADAVAREQAEPADMNARVVNLASRKPKPKAKAQAVETPKRAPQAVARPDAVDDLKLIAGIGPKLEQVLNGLGVWTYAQIAGWQAEEIAWVDDQLGLNGRIGNDKWLEQAAELARAGTQKRDYAAG